MGENTQARGAARASRALADYVAAHFPAADRRIAVGYDGRPGSEASARDAAAVFAANGAQAFLFAQPTPAPTLSYAARVLQCAAGAMLTEGDGYRLYGPDGCRMGAEIAEAARGDGDGPNALDEPRSASFDEALERGRIAWVPDWVTTSYVKEVKRQSLLCGAPVDKSFSIAYAPMNGACREVVLRALDERGYANVTVLPEIGRPDGRALDLPEAMRLALERAGGSDVDLLLVTDADCGRCGVALRGPEGLCPLTGDAAGLALLDYVCRRRQELGVMQGDPALVVTSDAPEAAAGVAARYGVRAVSVPPGFENIGRAVARLEAEGRPDSFIFGLEAGGGCLTGRYARDRDGVSAAVMLCDMFALKRVNNG